MFHARAGPAGRYCLAGVCEFVDGDRGERLQFNAQDCARDHDAEHRLGTAGRGGGPKAKEGRGAQQAVLQREQAKKKSVVCTPQGADEKRMPETRPSGYRVATSEARKKKHLAVADRQVLVA